MQTIQLIAHNRVLIVALCACFLAQGLKPLFELAFHQRLNFKSLMETGGMPSAHSALVAALATGVGQTVGWDSIEFALATIFAVIVMYDAAGVRQAAGKQARVLNQIVDEFFEGDHSLSQDRLKELLGHTPVQVIVGCLLGVAVAWLSETIAQLA